MTQSSLQLFLLINMFLIGVLSAIAAQHAYAHFRPRQPKEPQRRAQQASPGLTTAMRKEILEAAQADFEAVLEKSAIDLQRELHVTAASLNQRIAKTGAEVVSFEMERYRTELAKLREQTEAALGGAQKEVSAHQAELNAEVEEKRAALEATLAEEMAAEKQRLSTQIDTRLADAVVSFLTETLQHNVDLGAQSRYLISMLEEHKADIKRELGDEA